MKKTNWKQLLSLLLAMLMLCCVLVGCTPQEQPDVDGDGDGDNSGDVIVDGGNDGDGVVDGGDGDVVPPIPDDGKLTDEQLKELYESYQPILSKTLPVVRIDTAESDQGYFTHAWSDVNYDWPYIGCTVSVDNCEDKYLFEQLSAQIKVRGNYTSTYEKKPFRIKFDKKTNMLGLNNGQKFKNWVLLAEYKDASLLRNALSMYLAKKILGTDGYYSSDYRHVVLYINGQYEGVYGLVEQQQVNEGRVDVFEPDKDYTDTDIGYFFEYDGYYYSEDPSEAFEMNYYFSETGTKGITVKSDLYSTEQRDFLHTYLENVYKIMYWAANGKCYKFNQDYTDIVESGSRDTKQAVCDVVDVQSLVDMYILQEIARDPDIGWSSFFMSVDFSAQGDKKLRFVAPWDFDSAFGHKQGFTPYYGEYARFRNNPWLRVLSTQDWFVDMIKEKWATLHKFDVFEQVKYYCMYITTYNKDDLNDNYKRWKILGNDFGELDGLVKNFTSQLDAANYLLKWYDDRIAFLDTIWL